MMEYVLEPLENVNVSSNSLTGAFLNMMRYKGVEYDELRVQLLSAGIRLNLTYSEQINLYPNFLQGIHNFCAKTRVDYRRVETNAEQLKEVAFDILSKNGAFMLQLDSGSFNYYKAIMENQAGHCVTVTGMDSEGIYVLDSCASCVPGSVFRGKIYFEDIREIQQGRTVQAAFVAGIPETKIKKLEANIKIERQKFINENIELELGSRLKTSLDYCEYLASDMRPMKDTALRRIANNIMTETHVPQLKMILKLFGKDREKDAQLSHLCNDWMLLAYRLLKESFGSTLASNEVLIENYKCLIYRERDIYRQ